MTAVLITKDGLKCLTEIPDKTIILIRPCFASAGLDKPKTGDVERRQYQLRGSVGSIAVYEEVN